jgi:hypothetical protein
VGNNIKVVLSEIEEIINRAMVRKACFVATEDSMHLRMHERTRRRMFNGSPSATDDMRLGVVKYSARGAHSVAAMQLNGMDISCIVIWGFLCQVL